MLQNENPRSILIGIEGVPEVGKSTLWNLFCEGKYSEVRNRSSKLKTSKLDEKKIKSLFKKELPKGFFKNKNVSLVDLPGHTIFEKYKMTIRRNFSAGVLMINPKKISESDYLLSKWYYDNKIPLIILANTYEKEDLSINQLEQILQRFPEYVSPFSKELHPLSYIEWSSKINKNWGRFLFFIFNLIEPLEDKIKTDTKKDTRNSKILYVTSSVERAFALEESLQVSIIHDTFIRKELLMLNQFKLIINQKKVTKKELELIREYCPSVEILIENDFFKIIPKAKELLKKKEPKRNKEIIVLKILKRYSEKKNTSLLGIEVLCGFISVNLRLYSITKNCKVTISSIESEGRFIDKLGKGQSSGILVKGCTKEISDQYLFGQFILSNKIEGKYTEEELYWLNYCGKKIKD